ncbi:MAG: site-specific integrase [Chitinispirillaceae bacterium]|nr:site-specific integrase [Chitinispirillaceae bacterium]
MNIEQVEAGLWLIDARFFKDGIQYRKRESFQGTRKNAELRFWELKKELQETAKKSNRSLKPSVTTFEHMIDYYLARHPINPKSLCYFERLKKDLGSTTIEGLRDRFDRYVLLLRKSKSYTGRVLSNQTINHYVKWANAAINFCVRCGVVDRNPLQYFVKFKTVPRSRILSEEEKWRLISTVREKAPHIYPIVLFAFLVPSRRGELVTLKRTDYDMVNNHIMIPADRTKNKRPCIKPVPDCLKGYMRNVPPESEYLFYRRDWRGRCLPLGDFRKAFKRCLKLAGIEDFRFHDTRRQSYTSLLLNGNAPHIVMQVSGHATDMSKVYFGRDGLYAAKALKFGEICTPDLYTQGSDSVKVKNSKVLGL